MEVFWARGYEQASLDALCEATTLNRSSLYNAFGSKLGLFHEALARYAGGPALRVVEPLMRERGTGALRKFLGRLCEFVESPGGSRGCLFVKTAASDAGRHDQVADHVDAHFHRIRSGIERAYREALADGEIAKSRRLDPAAVAGWLVTFVRGTLTSAASGVAAAQLCESIHLTEQQLGLC